MEKNHDLEDLFKIIKRYFLLNIKNRHFTKIKAIYELFTDNPIRFDENNFKNNEEIENFIYNFRRKFNDLFINKLNDENKLKNWFRKLEVKNRYNQLMNENELYDFENNLIRNRKEIINGIFIYCPFCMNKLEKDAEICPYCGSSIN
ncbi:MAG: hypothetical protein ACTSQP_07545 [Promethearchaeota archaeon]